METVHGEPSFFSFAGHSTLIFPVRGHSVIEMKERCLNRKNVANQLRDFLDLGLKCSGT